MSAATVHVDWKPAFLAVPVSTRAPYARIAGNEDVAALHELADLADPLARDAAGIVPLFAVQPQAPAFAYPALWTELFSGVAVVARERGAAIAGAAGRSAVFMSATRETPASLPLRLDLFDIEGDFVERQDGAPFRPDGADGVLFDSPHGECVAVFNPAAAAYGGEQARLLLEWDGEKIAAVYERIPLP